MWVPMLPPDPVVAGWWAAADRAEQDEAGAAVARLEERAARIEHLRQRVHRADMALAAVQSRDRWRRIQRRGEQRSAGSDGGDESESWRGLPVEHGPAGRVLGVR